MLNFPELVPVCIINHVEKSIQIVRVIGFNMSYKHSLVIVLREFIVFNGKLKFISQLFDSVEMRFVLNEQDLLNLIKSHLLDLFIDSLVSRIVYGLFLVMQFLPVNLDDSGMFLH